MDAFEATLLAYFGRAVDILDVEDATESVENNFRQSGHELTCGHQHVDTILSRDVERMMVRLGGPGGISMPYRCLMIFNALMASVSHEPVKDSMSTRN